MTNSNTNILWFLQPTIKHTKLHSPLYFQVYNWIILRNTYNSIICIHFSTPSLNPNLGKHLQDTSFQKVNYASKLHLIHTLNMYHLLLNISKNNTKLKIKAFWSISWIGWKHHELILLTLHKTKNLTSFLANFETQIY